MMSGLEFDANAVEAISYLRIQVSSLELSFSQSVDNSQFQSLENLPALKRTLLLDDTGSPGGKE